MTAQLEYGSEFFSGPKQLTFGAAAPPASAAGEEKEGPKAPEEAKETRASKRGPGQPPMPPQTMTVTFEPKEPGTYKSQVGFGLMECSLLP